MKLSELCIEAARRVDGHKNMRIASAVTAAVANAGCHYSIAFILLGRIQIFYPYVNDAIWPYPSEEERQEKVIALLLASASFMPTETLFDFLKPHELV